MANIIILYKFIKYQKESSQQRTVFYWMGFVYILISICTCIINWIAGIDFWLSCWQPTDLFVNFVSPLMYGIQTAALWIVLFMRAYTGFKGSAYQLSKYTNYCFILFLSIMVLLMIFLAVPIWNDQTQPIRDILIGFCFLSTIGFCIWITGFFIYKLHKISTNVHLENDGRLLSTITRNTILCTFSIGATLFTFLMWGISFTNWSIAMQISVAIVTILDSAMNLFCVVLMYGIFETWYNTLCGCIDSECRSCCNNSNIESKVAHDIESTEMTATSPKSISSDNRTVEISYKE